MRNFIVFNTWQIELFLRTSILHGALAKKDSKFVREMIALQLLRNDLKPLSPQSTVYEALQLADEFKIAHVPVADGDVFIGVVSEAQLLDITNDEAPLSSIPALRIFMPADKHVFDAIHHFGEHKLSLLPVLDTHERYIGYLHPQDIAAMLGSMLSSKIPGSIVVLEVNQSDYQLSQIAQIVESNDAKILASYITSAPNSTLLEITLRINRKDLTAILQTFQRYNYAISATYHESAHTLDLQDRYDNFIKFLNM